MGRPFGALEDAAYLDRLRALRESKASLEANGGGAVTGAVALAWLREDGDSGSRDVRQGDHRHRHRRGEVQAKPLVCAGT
jgi:hypothetical protein